VHKAIRLKVNLWLWIEGEAEPAEDFAALTSEAVRGLIAAGSEQYPGLAVTIQKIEEDRSEEAEADGG
jgi:hypothetical protein